MGLTKKMLLVLLVPTVIIIAGLSFYSFISSQDALDVKINQSANYEIHFYASTIQSRITHKEATLRNMANMINGSDMSDEEMAAIINHMQKANKDILNISLGLENKKYFCTDGWIPTPDYDHTSRDWYKIALNTQDIIYSDIYEDATYKVPVISISQQIRDSNNNLRGVVSVDLVLEEYIEIAKNIKIGKTGYVFILDNNGNFVYHPQYAFKDNITTINGGEIAETGKKFLTGKQITQRATLAGVEKMYTSIPVGKTNMILCIILPVSELYEDITAIGWTTLVSGIVAILLLGVIIVYNTFKLVQPLSKLSTITENIKNGDLSVDTDSFVNTAPKDEIGMLIKNFHIMKNQIKGLIKQVTSATEHVTTASEKLTASAELSIQSADKVSLTINAVSEDAKKQLKTVNTVISTVENISNSINLVANNANLASDQSEQAALVAKSGNSVVEKAVNQMINIEQTVGNSAKIVMNLGDSSKEIGQIVNTISTIAGQTNLLALNAAIEAARAGEEGRGFAVVADEVRKLAEQSEKATKQISQLITEIQTNTDNAVSAMTEGTREVKLGARMVDEAGSEFYKIVELVTNVSEQVKDISASMQEMSTASRDLVFSVEEIDDISKETALHTDVMKDQTKVMHEIASDSLTLAHLAEQLKISVSKFKI